MKRFHIIGITVAILLVFGVIFARSRSHVHLTILLNGSPAAHLTVTDFQTLSPRKLDATGSVSYGRDLSKLNAVFVPTGNGSQQMVALPEQGHKTVDLRGRMVVSKTVRNKLGFFKSFETTEQFDLTDTEMTAVEAGEVARTHVLESIREEAEP